MTRCTEFITDKETGQKRQCKVFEDVINEKCKFHTRCLAIKKDREKCKNFKDLVNGYCEFHSPKNNIIKCIATKINGEQCKNYKDLINGYCEFHLNRKDNICLIIE